MMVQPSQSHQRRRSRSSSGSKPHPTHYSTPVTSTSNSYFWLICFALAVVAILFSHEISDFLYTNDQNHILKQYASQRTPNISAWTITPMPSKGGGYGVVATRRILPGELIIKETPLVKIRIGPTTLEKANQKVKHAIEALDEEDRNQFLSLSNVWDNRTVNGIQMNKYAGIFQTNGIKSGHGYMAIFPSIARINHACIGAVNAIYSWRENEGVQVVHVTKPVEAGEEIFVTYFDSKLPLMERQAFLRQAYDFDCKCDVCSLEPEEARESDQRVTRINSLKATLSAWTAKSIGGAETVQLIEDAIETMRQEGMTYEFGQLYADAAHVATAHSDFQNARHYALLAAQHFTIELGPDSVEVAVAKKFFQNPTSSNVWATRFQETVRQ